MTAPPRALSLWPESTRMLDHPSFDGQPCLGSVSVCGRPEFDHASPAISLGGIGSVPWMTWVSTRSTPSSVTLHDDLRIKKGTRHVSDTLVQDLLDAGIHFGQRRSGWNPRMKPYIWGQRNRIHIIDIRQTVKGLLTGVQVHSTHRCGRPRRVYSSAPSGKPRLPVEQHATDVNMPWVVERWLGGTLDELPYHSGTAQATGRT